jgi:streptogramin lyase
MALVAALLTMTALLAGCGSGGGTDSSRSVGALTFDILWPEQTRLIPEAAQSIKVDVRAQGSQTVVATQAISRPPIGTNTTTVTFPAVPVGPVTITATAYPQPNAQGTPLATGSVNVTIIAGQTVTAPDLTMASTINTIEVVSNKISPAGGETFTLTATAKNQAGAVVMTTPGKLQWTASQGVTFQSSGSTATASAAPGTYVFSVTDQESGKTGQVSVTVSGQGTTSPARIIIASLGNKKVIGLDQLSATSNPTAYVMPQASTAWDVATDPQGRVYIGEHDTALGINRIVRVDNIVTGAGRVVLNTPAAPVSVHVDAQGRIYYTQAQEGTVIRVDDITGANPVTLSDPGLRIDGPGGITTDTQGRIYVVDVMGNDITRFDNMAGANPVTFGSTGNGVGQFDFGTSQGAPGAIDLDAQGRIYIADYNNRRIVRINDMTGAGWTTMGMDPFNAAQKPIAIAVERSTGRIFYTTSDNKIVVVNDITNPLRTTLTYDAADPRAFNAPRGLALR